MAWRRSPAPLRSRRHAEPEPARRGFLFGTYLALNRSASEEPQGNRHHAPARHSEIDETISRGAGLHLCPAGRIGRQAHPAAVPRLSDSGAYPVGERFDRRRARKGTTLTTRSLAIGAESEIERVIVAAVEQRVRGDVAAWRAGTAYPRLCRPMVNRRDRAE